MVGAQCARAGGGHRVRPSGRGHGGGQTPAAGDAARLTYAQPDCHRASAWDGDASSGVSSSALKRHFHYANSSLRGQEDTRVTNTRV